MTVPSLPAQRQPTPVPPLPPLRAMPDVHRPQPPLGLPHGTDPHSPPAGSPQPFAPAHGRATSSPPARLSPRRTPWWRRPLPLIGTGVLLAAVLTVLAVVLLPGSDDPEDGDSTESARTPETVTVVVDGTQMWTDAGVDVRAGDRVAVTAGGQVFHNEGNSIGPEGFPNRPDLLTPFPELNHAALIGRIGDSDDAFYLGTSQTITAETDGRLYLGVNDGGLENNRGSWDATVDIEPAAGA